MTYLSLFTGAGGGDLAMQHLLGFKCKGYVEYEPYCQKLIKQRIEDGLLDAAPIFGDIRAFISEGYAEAYQGMVDLVTGGFPCQDISSVGKHRGITGAKSGLWFEMAECIRIIQPRFAFVENSPRLLIRGFERVLSDLAEMGSHARWGVLGAGLFGSPHLRERIWLLAHHTNVSEHERLKTELKILARSFACPPRFCGWESEPGMGRVANEHADRLDRAKSIGNGQVPIVAATAFRILSGGLA
jgi:DNA (cytosine-5)-methyltransferase 1